MGKQLNLQKTEILQIIPIKKWNAGNNKRVRIVAIFGWK